MAFIRQYKLKDKAIEDISEISQFRYTAWDFLLSIYESGGINSKLRIRQISINVFLYSLTRNLLSIQIKRRRIKV